MLLIENFMEEVSSGQLFLCNSTKAAFITQYLCHDVLVPYLDKSIHVCCNIT